MRAGYLNSYVEYKKENKITPTQLFQILNDEELRQIAQPEKKPEGLKDIYIRIFMLILKY